MKNRNLGAIILAAGRGKRMKLKSGNKTSMLLNGKPLISYPVELLKKMEIDPVIVVVGHAKNSVQKALANSNVKFATQMKRLGTAHAVKSAMPAVPEEITDILVMNGDDAYSYTEEMFSRMIKAHFENTSALTFLTLNIENPEGLGRVIRNKRNQVVDVVEEKDATLSQKLIKEINPNCYIFQIKFLKKYLSKICKSPVTGEYYLPGLIKLAFENNEKILNVAGGHLLWRGINTREELDKAQELLVTLNR